MNARTHISVFTRSAAAIQRKRVMPDSHSDNLLAIRQLRRRSRAAEITCWRQRRSTLQLRNRGKVAPWESGVSIVFRQANISQRTTR